MKKGFTLLELLVSIAIIALLAAATFGVYDNVKTKSRDASRMSDIGEIRNGLNLYLTDNAVFPVHPGGIVITGTDALSTLLISGEYMSEVPYDVFTPTYNYIYTSNSSGTNFTLSFCLEGDSIPEYSPGCVNSVSP